MEPHLKGRPHAVKLAKKGLGRPVWAPGVGVVVGGMEEGEVREGVVQGGEVRGDVRVEEEVHIQRGEEVQVGQYEEGGEYGEEEGEEGEEEEEEEEEEEQEDEEEDEEGDEDEGEEEEGEEGEEEPHEEVDWVSDNTRSDWPEIPDQSHSSMSWRCTACDETMSVFFKDAHLSSKPHIKRFLGQSLPRPTTTTTTTTTAPFSMTWQCITCDETMNVFYKEEHLSGKRHLRSLRSHSSSQDSVTSKDVPESVPSVYWTPDEYDVEATVSAVETPTRPSWAWTALMSSMEQQTAADEFHEPTVDDQKEPERAAGIPLYPMAGDGHGLGLEDPVGETNPDWSVAPEHNQLWVSTDAKWTCMTCSTTIWVGERDAHLASAEHMARCSCEVCVLNRPSASEELLEPGNETGDPDDEQAEILYDEPAEITSDEPAAPPGCSRTSPEMFYCRTCDAEFRPELKWQHLSKAWKCTVCDRWLHISWQETHLERHSKKAQPPPEAANGEALFYCAVCDLGIKSRYRALHQGATWQCTVCNLAVHVVGKAQHEAGETHVRKLEEQNRDLVYAQQHVEQGNLIDLLGDVDEDPILGFPPMPLGRNQFSTENDGWDLVFGGGEPHLLDEALEPESESQCRSGAASVLGEHPDHESTYGSQSTLQEIGDEDSTEEIDIAPEENGLETFRCSVCGDKEYSIEKKEYHLTGAWKCEVCDKTIHVSSRDTHLAGTGHRTRERKSRTIAVAIAPPPASSAASDALTFYCEVCRRTFKTKQERIHRTRPWECIVCNITIHIAWRQGHTAGTKHLKRLEKQQQQQQQQQQQAAPKPELEPEPEPESEPELEPEPEHEFKPTIARGLPAWVRQLRKLQRVQARHSAWAEEMKRVMPEVYEVTTPFDAAAWSKKAWARYQMQVET